jgi:hypothetical protein
MKKHIAAALVLAAGLAAAVGAALAAPGDSGDPLVTKSYLTGTYLPQVEQAALQRAQGDTARTEQAALDRLEALTQGYLERVGASGTGEASGAFQRAALSRGDRAALSAGASLWLEAGRCTGAVAGGKLIDVTAGTALSGSVTLEAGHRYLAAEGAACDVTVLSDAAVLSVEGAYKLERVGAAQTPFTDLVGTDWYYSYARFAYERGLFQGVDDTTFAPASPMTRSMLATVLYRLAGAPAGVSSAGFSDVGDTWYTDAVNWAAQVGVVTGSDGAFSPETDVTREQMAAMLYRYAGSYLGLDVSASGALSAYPDADRVSSWAEQAMSWAVGAGIINGTGDGTLAPTGNASRAEVAAMLQRFCNLIGT